MDEQIPVSTILRVISRGGTASLDGVMQELAAHARPGSVARAFQSARARGLIEVDPKDHGSRDPLYRLTEGGHEAVTRPSARNAHGSGVASRRQSTRKQEISVLTVLDVLADFDQFGGASPELVAWELDKDASLIAPAWSRALADGLLEQGETDHTLGENLYRLSERGRRAREQSDDVSA